MNPMLLSVCLLLLEQGKRYPEQYLPTDQEVSELPLALHFLYLGMGLFSDLQPKSDGQFELHSNSCAFQFCWTDLGLSV